jgi:hypothetical protein
VMSEQLRLDGVPQGTPSEGLSLDFLVKVFDCTQRNVQLLVDKGVITRLAKDLYGTDSVTRYIKYLREHATGKVNSPKMLDAKEREQEARATFLELRVGKLAGDLHHTLALQRFLGGPIKGAVSRLRSLPVEHGAKWFKCRSKEELVEAIQTALDTVLTGVAALDMAQLNEEPVTFYEFEQIEQDVSLSYPPDTPAHPTVNEAVNELLGPPTQDEPE